MPPVIGPPAQNPRQLDPPPGGNTLKKNPQARRPTHGFGLLRLLLVLGAACLDELPRRPSDHCSIKLGAVPG